MANTLFEACKSCNTPQLKELLFNGVDPNVRDSEGWTPLHYAAEEGYEDGISLLIDAGADVNAINPSGYSAYYILMICENYSPSIIAKLYSAGAELGSDLHEAILLNIETEINYLIERKKFINAKDDLGNTPLHMAIAANRADLITPLIEAGANIDDVDDYQTTPLHEASAVGQDYAVMILLNLGSSIDLKDYNGRTALIFAIGNAHPQTAEILINNHASVNIQDNFGNTALHYAFENEEFELAEYLIKNGADENLVNEDGQTPFMMTPYYVED